MRIVFFADTHLGFDYPVRPRSERRRRGEDFFDNFRRVLDHSARTRPDLLVHGGDLFFRSKVPPKTVDLAYQELLKFAKNGIPLFLVPGNHERSVLPASLWLTEPNIYVFDRPRTFHVSSSGIPIAISGFPFVRDEIRQRFKSELEATGWQENFAGPRILCMHQTVEGAQVGPSDYTFRSGPDVVKMSDIPRDLVAVLSGHIHRKQILRKSSGKGDPPIIYSGSTERTSFAEKDEPKGFFEIALARVQGCSWCVRKIEFIELPTRPMTDIDIDPAIDLPRLRAHLMRKLDDVDQNAIVRLRGIDNLEDSIRNSLTASFLRSIFPTTMNVEATANPGAVANTPVEAR